MFSNGCFLFSLITTFFDWIHVYALKKHSKLNRVINQKIIRVKFAHLYLVIVLLFGIKYWYLWVRWYRVGWFMMSEGYIEIYEVIFNKRRNKCYVALLSNDVLLRFGLCTVCSINDAEIFNVNFSWWIDKQTSRISFIVQRMSFLTTTNPIFGMCIQILKRGTNTRMRDGSTSSCIILCVYQPFGDFLLLIFRQEDQ